MSDTDRVSDERLRGWARSGLDRCLRANCETGHRVRPEHVAGLAADLLTAWDRIARAVEVLSLDGHIGIRTDASCLHCRARAILTGDTP